MGQKSRPCVLVLLWIPWLYHLPVPQLLCLQNGAHIRVPLGPQYFSDFQVYCCSPDLSLELKSYKYDCPLGSFSSTFSSFVVLPLTHWYFVLGNTSCPPISILPFSLQNNRIPELQWCMWPDYVSQTPLQLHVAMWSSFSQWDVTRNDIQRFWVWPLAERGKK